MDSYHRVNTLYDGMINCFSTVAQSSIASNKTFTYKEAMRESDYHEFVKAMCRVKEWHCNTGCVLVPYPNKKITSK